MKQLENIREELEQLENLQQQVTSLTAETIKFIRSLKDTFTHSLPQEKLTAVRQCTTRIQINAKTQQIEIAARIVPVADLQLTATISASTSRPV
jgi:hypothetical protein